MSSNSLQILLDETAGDLITADYDCAQDVIALCSSFENLRDLTRGSGLQKIPNALNRAIELINIIATEKTCERDAVSETLNKLFSLIQYAVRPGSDPETDRKSVV